MKLNLDSMRPEIQEYLESHGLVVFHCLSRGEEDDGVYWDLKTHPDYRTFVAAAAAAGVRMITMCATQFDADVIDLAMERLKESGMDLDGRRSLERRLKEMRAYSGFTCQIELSFDLAPRVYVFDLRTDWFEELNVMIDEIDDAYEDQDDEEPLQGYFSKN